MLHSSKIGGNAKMSLSHKCKQNHRILYEAQLVWESMKEQPE